MVACLFPATGCASTVCSVHPVYTLSLNAFLLHLLILLLRHVVSSSVHFFFLSLSFPLFPLVWHELDLHHCSACGHLFYCNNVAQLQRSCHHEWMSEWVCFSLSTPFGLVFWPGRKSKSSRTQVQKWKKRKMISFLNLLAFLYYSVLLEYWSTIIIWTLFDFMLIDIKLLYCNRYHSFILILLLHLTYY